MKKIVGILMIIIIALSCVSIINYEDTGYTKVRVADDALYSDSGYVDYAEEVYFDTETYPELADQGLFWNYYDEATGTVIEVAADSEEGAALVDPSKPTIVMVHGMITDGYQRRDMMLLNSEVSTWEEYSLEGDDDDAVPMMMLWLEQGYNVATFQYHRFTIGFIALPGNVESKIWSTDGDHGVSYNTSSSTEIDNATDYSIAEHFAAEYLRAMQYLPDTFGDEEIRVVAHSMGGEVSAAGIFLLTELADSSVGQLDSNQLPDRYAMLDTYFSTNVIVNDNLIYTGPTDITISWSDKLLVNNNMGDTIIEALKDLAANGIALEYYTNESSFLRGVMSDEIRDTLQEIAVYVIVQPDWSSYKDGEYTELSDGHEGVKFWYLSSIWFDSPIVVDENGNATGEIAPSAAMSTAQLLALKGTGYVISGGQTTIRSDDDTFIKGYID
ncbi:MAG: hypothetical protein R3Y23_04835 [Bacillota bacterium]